MIPVPIGAAVRSYDVGSNGLRLLSDYRWRTRGQCRSRRRTDAGVPGHPAADARAHPCCTSSARNLTSRTRSSGWRRAVPCGAARRRCVATVGAALRGRQLLPRRRCRSRTRRLPRTPTRVRALCRRRIRSSTPGRLCDTTAGGTRRRSRGATASLAVLGTFPKVGAGDGCQVGSCVSSASAQVSASSSFHPFASAVSSSGGRNCS